MTKKFYQTKEFIKQQKEWYDKLKQDGFNDLEWFHSETGLGQGSPYLKSEGNMTTGEIRRKYSLSLAQHYRLCQNFLAHGPFHLNLAEKYYQNDEISATYSNFGAFLANQAQKYSLAESILWELYCTGFTVRKISIELRRLFQLGLLIKPAKRWGKSAKGLPYSVYWVKHRVDKLKEACYLFNLISEEGMLKDDDDGNAWQGGSI